MKILIAGDFCDRYRVSSSISNEEFEYLFHDITPLTKKCDYNIVNFEFPVVIKDSKPIHKCGPNLKGQIKAVDAIKYAGFNVCTLANNHILDQGEECCLETKKLLEENHINTVGVGENLEDASKILYLKKDNEVLAIINCCEHEFSIATENNVGANPLNSVQQYYKIQEAKKIADYVVIIVHGGHEHFQLPSPRMQEIYRFFVEVGADAVVNHHQHCFSGYEIYRGKPIFYGIGNFLFDDPRKRHSIWNEGYMVEITFNKSDFPSYHLYPYEQCNDSVGVSLLNNKTAERFQETLKGINAVIQEPKELKKLHREWMDSTFKEYELTLQPVRTRITDALFVRHLFPSFLTKSRKLLLYNFMACESHLERFIHALSLK